MNHRHCWLGILLLLAAIAPEAAGARIIERYDTDSLCALSTLIVRVELGEPIEVKTRDGDCAVCDVKVIATLKGDAKVDSIIRVAGVEQYRKGPGIEGGDKTYPRIAKGDVVYLFLMPRDAPRGYAKYHLTDADWKIVDSGARLVVKDTVYGFAQYMPNVGPSMGPVAGYVTMTAETFPKATIDPIKIFEQQVQKSIQFVDDLRRKMAEGGLKPEDKKEMLDARAEVLKKEQAHTDYIPFIIYDEEPTTRPRP